MKSIRTLALLAAVAVGLSSLTACGVGTGAADSTASTPASSHFNADLATGYGALQAVRTATTTALKAGAITATQAQAVQTQCKAFTASLDSLRATGNTGTSQTTLTATLAAINAAAIFVAVTQGTTP